MKLIHTLIFILSFTTLIAQPGPAFMLKGEISNFRRAETFYLLSIRGSAIEAVDSMHSENGRFLFIADSILPSGEYMIFWGDDFLLPLLISNEKYIEIHADELEASLNPEVIVSQENSIYFLFKKIEYQIDSLIYLGDYYYEKEQYDKLSPLQEQINLLQNKALHQADSIAETQSNSFALKIFKSNIPPDFYSFQKDNPDHQYKNENHYLKSHYFDNIDKNDSNLVRTTVLYDACSFYLRNMTEEKSIEAYKKSCNFMLSTFSKNNAQFEYVLDLLLNTFESAELGEVYLYLFDTYMYSTICKGGIPGEDERKALAFRNLTKSAPAPKLSAKDRNGNTHSLSDFKGKIVILMFWSSTCSHCEDAIPHIIELVEKNKEQNLVLLSFSLDTDKDEWLNALLRNEIPEPALSDLGGFDGKNALSWHIWATPSFFLIDKNEKIYSKPMTLSKLEQDIKELFKM